MMRCLSCEQDLGTEKDYHRRCLLRVFGSPDVPTVPFGRENFPAEVQRVAGRMSAISGVQPKAFVKVDAEGRLVFAEKLGTHIIKPPQTQWPELPQNENLCMRLAESLGMETAAHALVRMADGEMAYITRRFDRDRANKIHKEDMAQILGKSVGDKYEGSLEKVGQALNRHSTFGGLETINFFERVLLCFLTGNADMHLKNWSLLEENKDTRHLAPCYDFVSTALYIPDGDESALTINGKRAKLTRADFEALGSTIKINEKAIQNAFRRVLAPASDRLTAVRNSFLSATMKNQLSDIIQSRSNRLVQMSLKI